MLTTLPPLCRFTSEKEQAAAAAAKAKAKAKAESAASGRPSISGRDGIMGRSSVFARGSVFGATGSGDGSSSGSSAGWVEVLTPQWSPPEVLAGRSGATQSADVYSLCVVLVEILAGVVPFDGAWGGGWGGNRRWRAAV